MFLFFHRFHDKETMNAIGRGEAVAFWSGRPKGRQTWSSGPNPFAPKDGWVLQGKNRHE